MATEEAWAALRRLGGRRWAITGYTESGRALRRSEVRRTSLLIGLLAIGTVAQGADAQPWLDKLEGADASDARTFESLVREAVLAMGDRDGSGMLDHRSELVAVPCAFWSAVDGQIRSSYQGGLVSTYGLHGRTLFHGDRLGIAEPSREESASVVGACVGVDQGMVDQIRDLPEAGNQDWDEQVRAILLNGADDDRSGALELDEVRAVGCDTWRVIDERVQKAWDGGVRDVYGFSSPERVWIGYTLGVEPGARVAADTWLGECGLAAEMKPGWADLPPAPPDLDPTSLADAIRAVEGGGSSSWDEVVRRRVVGGLDEDGSGAVDTPAELSEAGCDVWEAIDDGVRQRWAQGFLVTYSVAEADNYLGGLLGFAAPVRSLVNQRAVACGIVSGAVAQVPDEPELAAWDADDTGLVDSKEELASIGCADWRRTQRAVGLVRQTTIEDLLALADPALLGGFGLSVSLTDSAGEAFAACKRQGPEDLDGLVRAIGQVPEGGSSTWDETVMPMLLDQLDKDASGRLDSVEEVGAVSCEVWTALDIAVRSGWDDSIANVYGFAPQKLWVGSSLGFDEGMRRAAHRALGGCGLVVPSEGSPVDPRLAAQVDLMSTIDAEPGTKRWEAVVRAEVLSYDLDASGFVDKKSELFSVPCTVWRDVDRGAFEGWGQPLMQAFGISRGLTYEAEVLGVAKKLRRPLARSIEACILP